MSTAISALGPAVTAPAGTALPTGLTAQAAPEGQQPAQPRGANRPALSGKQMQALRAECEVYRKTPESQSPPIDLVGELGTLRLSCLGLDMMDALRAVPKDQK
jgi:hypothetical protein